MIRLEITEDERDLLADLLETTIADLRMEIADTDRWEYKNMLKEREALIRTIQNKLTQG